MTTNATEDIPALVAEEMRAAQLANIPLSDQPKYVADKLRLRIAGTVEYTRKRPLSPAHRAAAIRNKFTGNNAAELAKEHDLTPRRVKQIVNGK